MRKKLQKLFDYQKFEHNSKLEELVLGVDLRYAGSLSDAQLECVNAAGSIEEQQAEKEKQDKMPSESKPNK